MKGLLTVLLVIVPTVAEGATIWPKGVPLDVLNSTTSEVGPSLSADGRTLYFSSSRAGNADVYQSIGSGLDWAPPTLVPGVNTPANDQHPSISRDGQTLMFSSNRGGNYDLYETTWAGAAWGPVMPIVGVNSPGGEYFPQLVDPLTLWFSSDRPGGKGSFDLYESTRATIGDPWGTPSADPFALLNSSAPDFHATRLANEETMYYWLHGSPITIRRSTWDDDLERWNASEIVRIAGWTRGTGSPWLSDEVITVENREQYMYYIQDRYDVGRGWDLYASMRIIPEPSTALLFVLGIVGLVTRRRHEHQQ